MRQECTIAGCARLRVGNGYCRSHYDRWRRHGNPLAGGTAWGAAAAFLENTVLSFDGNECLAWPFTLNSAGYGQINQGGKKYLVGRVICERIHGPAPSDRHQAAHSCGKGHEGCCNPNHLRWATVKENAEDKISHGTDAKGQRNGRSKLTDAQVMKIRASTRPQRDVAKEFGVSESSIHLIKARKNWAWLGEAS